jgi:hypothetical protein
MKGAAAVQFIKMVKSKANIPNGNVHIVFIVDEDDLPYWTRSMKFLTEEKGKLKKYKGELPLELHNVKQFVLGIKGIKQRVATGECKTSHTVRISNHSKEPSMMPSQSPSTMPSQAPSKELSMMPSQSPSKNPSKEPS